MENPLPIHFLIWPLNTENVKKLNHTLLFYLISDYDFYL